MIPEKLQEEPSSVGHAKILRTMPLDAPVRLEAKAYPNARYINREENGGNTGLHCAKRSAHPLFLKQKYLGLFTELI